METIAVLILNYKRPRNVQTIILPSLVSNPLVSTIIIAHGLQSTVFGIGNKLADGEIVKNGKILHIGNFKENEDVGCFRRWRLIKQLKENGQLNETYIHSHDDDLVFDLTAFPILLQSYEEGKGILICGTPGRIYSNNQYLFKDVKENCSIALGRSIFTTVDIICKAVTKASLSNIPNEILKQDGICLSFLSLASPSQEDKHYSIECKYRDLPSNDALSNQKDHVMKRNNALRYFIV